MKRFDDAPFLAIWEVTQACDLACRHCRASAHRDRDPAELSSAEGFRLLDQVRSFGDPLMVFTGGDPLKRPDLFDLLRYSTSLGLRTTVTPSATPLLTSDAIGRFKECGVARMAISLDGPDAPAHDAFRGVAGSFERSLSALRHARRIGLETQVNTTVTRGNRDELSRVAEIVATAGARLWSVFFLVTTGRAAEHDDLTAGEYEEVFELLYELSKTAPFDIKTTEAQHYRRYVAQRRKAEAGRENRPAGPPPAIARHRGINDGRGLVFISHAGDVYPSGFLPVSAGNVRETPLPELYRNSSLFVMLRDVDSLAGKCGACGFRNLCGGSRSRAYALTGDYQESDPRCVYEPAAGVAGGAATAT